MGKLRFVPRYLPVRFIAGRRHTQIGLVLLDGRLYVMMDRGTHYEQAVTYMPPVRLGDRKED